MKAKQIAAIERLIWNTMATLKELRSELRRLRREKENEDLRHQ